MISFENTYLKLPQEFYCKVSAQAFPNSELISLNHSLASDMGLNFSMYGPQELTNYFCGQKTFLGSAMIATAYSGHQFGHLNPNLGDGRALLIGEVLTPNGQRFDIQLKGAGPTPYSRRGDGLSALGPVLREYLMSEAMNELGVPTTRALAAVKTGDFVIRERELPGGVFTRVASSHIRFGTFEYFAVRKDLKNLKILFEYTAQRHYPEVFETENPALAFFTSVGQRILKLVSQWMGLGFIHGVMNTDNMSICGETIDFGPCAFMQNFNRDQHFSSIDTKGRYRYSAQGEIALWNLSILAQCLVPLVHNDEAVAITLLQAQLNELAQKFDTFLLAEMSAKIGLEVTFESSKTLVSEYLTYLEKSKMDFTEGFLQIEKWMEESLPRPMELSSWFEKMEKLWALKGQQVTISLLQKKNPRRIPRNELLELAIASAYEGDLTHFYALQDYFKRPYGNKDASSQYDYDPGRVNQSHKTFCGT